LAIARPDLQVTLVESNGKKARFLREAVRQLGLANARVAETRAEALDEPGAHDAITARALAPLAESLAGGGHLDRPGGRPPAIARPDLQVTLVESNGKKARFLREAVRQLGLANARVAETRAEALDEPGAHDAITARALAPLAEILAVGGHLVRPGGRLLAMKG